MKALGFAYACAARFGVRLVRKPYAPPTLTPLGDVRSLTLGVGGSVSDTLGQQPPTPPTPN